MNVPDSYVWHIWSRVTHMNQSRHMWMRHVTYELVAPYMTVTSHLRMNTTCHAYDQVVPHLKETRNKHRYGVATVSRIDLITGLFCRISSLLYGSLAKESCNFIDPTNQSHPIWHALHELDMSHTNESFHIWRNNSQIGVISSPICAECTDLYHKKSFFLSHLRTTKRVSNFYFGL